MQGRVLGLFSLIRSLRASEPPPHKKDALGDESEEGGKRHHSATSLLLNKAKTRDNHEDKCIYLPLAPLPRALPHEPILLSPPILGPSPSSIRLVLTPRGLPHGYTFGLKASILFFALGSLNHLFGAEER